MGLFTNVEKVVDGALHHTRVAVDKAVAAEAAKAVAEKKLLVADAMTRITQLKAAAIAATPQVAAAAQKAFDDALKVLEQVAVEHGI